jgi:hypothetical protein
MKKFDRYFCEVMDSGEDFTLRLEVRGNDHKLLHCRVYKDEIDSAAGKKPVERKSNRRGIASPA